MARVSALGRMRTWSKCGPSGKVLASSDCVLPRKKTADLPSIAPMLDNDAAQLKAEIVEASDRCLVMFMGEMLGIHR